MLGDVHASIDWLVRMRSRMHRGSSGVGERELALELPLLKSDKRSPPTAGGPPPDDRRRPRHPSHRSGEADWNASSDEEAYDNDVAGSRGYGGGGRSSRGGAPQFRDDEDYSHRREKYSHVLRLMGRDDEDGGRQHRHGDLDDDDRGGRASGQHPLPRSSNPLGGSGSSPSRKYGSNHMPHDGDDDDGNIWTSHSQAKGGGRSTQRENSRSASPRRNEKRKPRRYDTTEAPKSSPQPRSGHRSSSPRRPYDDL